MVEGSPGPAVEAEGTLMNHEYRSTRQVGCTIHRRHRRRGVSSVLAMMFLVLFGSLAVAMAVVAQSNLRTADSALQVSRAMSAAETGLVFASRRLAEQSARWVVEDGVIDADFAEDLWTGSASVSDYDLLDADGYSEGATPAGIMQAIAYVHANVDGHAIEVEAGDASLPYLDDTLGVLEVKPIRVGSEDGGPYFRLRYELVDSAPYVRITSRGYDGDVVRELSMDFAITKKIEYAVISPNRIMIGKNVMIDGPLGSMYGIDATELVPDNGNPLVMRSDFRYLDDDLDTLIDLLYDRIADYDVDGDGRLRPEHPDESNGLTGESSLVDYDADEYVDDFDLFLAFYDSDGDFRVAYDATLAAAAGYGAMTVEYGSSDGDDTQLLRLIDRARPDRDGDGIDGSATDIAFGWNDGVIDVRDQYAKVEGRLRFSVAQSDWETARGADYQELVQGPIRSDIDQAPVGFEVDDSELLEVTTDMFSTNQTWFEDQVPVGSADFDDQAAAGGGSSGTQWEAVPFGSTGAYDYYDRPVYDGITFTNVRIPMGTNALFTNCTFIGVTWIESDPNCEHYDWNYAGSLQWDDLNEDGVIDAVEVSEKFPEIPAQEDIDAGSIVEDTRTVSNNLRFHNCTFLGSIGGDRINEYTHWRNKIQMTGATRFYLDPDDPELEEDITDGVPGAEDWETALEAISEADRSELAKSSVLMPGWSLDVGNFVNEVAADPEDTPVIKLNGVIIAGIFDVRGTAEVNGTLMMTFRPAVGEGPLHYGGQPDAFNTTIGYFGPDDGDGEGIDPSSDDFQGFGEIRLRYNPDALLPDGVPWPISVEAVPETYLEGGFS